MMKRPDSHQDQNRVIQELVGRIETAFPGIDLDGGISLRQAMLDDDWESDDTGKMKEAYRQDVTHDWREIPNEDLRLAFSSFSLFPYLDLKGWKYYLPATLRFSLIDDGQTDCDFFTFISLVPGRIAKAKGEWSVSKFVEWLELTSDQASVVAEWIQYQIGRGTTEFSDEYDAQAQDWVDAYIR